MSAFPTGVAIITTRDEDGTPRGLTTNALTSVSADPPLLLVCIDAKSRTLPALRAAGRFVVNFAREGRDLVCTVFASKAEDKFADVVWREAENGMPCLCDDSVAWAECATEQEVEAGDHTIFVARVTGGRPPGEADVPLMYFQRTYACWPGDE